MDEILGVVKLIPVPKIVPPVIEEYQLIVSVLAFAPKITVPVPQRVASVTPVIVGLGIIVAITAVLGVDAQLPLITSA